MQSQSEDAPQLRLVLHYVSNVAHVWYVPQHSYFSVSQLQFAALISFSSSYMHRASCHSQHVASSLINDVNDAFAAIACPDYFHRRATRSPQLESDRTRNIETLQKSILTKGKHTHTQQKKKHTYTRHLAAVARFLMPFELGACSTWQKVQKSNSKISTDSFHFIMHIAHTHRRLQLKALVWRKIVNFPPVDMCTSIL